MDVGSESGEAEMPAAEQSGSPGGLSEDNSLPLAQRIVLLAIVQVAFGLIALVCVYLAGGDVTMAALAWLACFVGTVGGHLASEFPKGNEFVLLRMASGMACRTLLPMAFAVWGAKFREPPVDKSAIAVLVFAYLIGLAVDSVLSLRRIKPTANDSN